MSQDDAVTALEQSGQPVIRINLSDVYGLSQEFFRWEIATAVAAAVLQVNPFDQPDVESGKVVTRELTDDYEKRGALPIEIPVIEADNDQVNVSFEFNDSRTHAFLVWQDYRNGSDFEIYGEVIDLASGELQQDEIQFSVDTTDQYNPRLSSLHENEFLVIWEDERGYYNDCLLYTSPRPRD